jgi:hypothetical protein
MKKIIFLFAIFFAGFQWIEAQTYCAGGPSSTFDSEIASVQLNGQTSNINYLQICPGTTGVNNQRLNHSADLVIGNNYTANIAFGTCGGNYNNLGTAYIDFNGNGIFEPSEAIGTTPATMAPFNSNYTFTVPPTAIPGVTAMRVIQWETGSQTLPLDPCATFTWGAVIDFNIQIIAPGPCTNATVTAATSDRGLVCVGEQVNLSATGVSFGTGTVYQWQVSTDGINFSNVTGANTVNYNTGPLAGSVWYRMEVTCGTLVAVSTPVQVIVIGTPLAGGTYTINSLLATGGTNFTNFTDFFSQVNCGGITGPVVLNVVSGTGPYNEAFTIGAVGNTSAINTLTINGNGEVVEFTNTDNNKRATITMEGCSYVTIDNLIVRANGTSVGYCIQMRNGANNNTVKNCQLEIPLTVTTTTFAGVVLNSGLTPTVYTANAPFANTIENNAISGGYYSVTLMGNSTTSPASGNKIINNTLENFHFYGIYSGGQEDYEFIGNDISRPSRPTYTSFYGIFCTGNHLGGDISKNAFHDPFGTTRNTSVMYPMYCTSASGTAAKPNNVYNNIFYNLNNNGTLYAIWNSSANFWNYYHNSIHVDDVNPTAGITYMVYLSGTSNDVNIVNNTIFLRRGGTSVKYAIYVLGTGTRNINNNGYFVDYTQGNTSFGFVGSARATFADWQANNGNNWDSFSVFDNPNFSFPAGGLLIPSAGSYDNIGQNLTAIVPNDYFDSVRTVTPDPGAFEFQGPPCSNPVGFVVDTFSSTSITVAWNQPGTAVNQWDIEWGPVGFTPGTTGGNQVTTGNNPHTIPSLTPGDCYDVYIRANCASIGQPAGSWVGPVTICLPTEYDIAVNSVLSPLRNDCGTTTFPISIQIQNVGTLNATGFSLHAILSGAATATLNMTYTGTLNSGLTDSVYLGDVNLVNGGNVDITTYVNYTLDQDNDNDTLVVMVPVNATAPSVISAAKDSLCPGEQMWLVTPSFPNRQNIWTDAANNQVGTGDSILVGPISGPTFYKVAPVAGGSETVGARDTTIGPITNFTNLSVQSLLVTVVNEVTVVEAKVYPANGGILDIEFRPLPIGSGTNITKSVAVPAPSSPGMPVIVPIDMTIPAGNYQMGANTSSTVGGLLRNGSGAIFPYGSNDFFVTGNTFSAGYYYYYYDIVVSTGVPCQIDGDSITLYPKTDTAFATFTDDVATGGGPSLNDFVVNFNASGSAGRNFTWLFGDGGTGSGLTPTHAYTTNGTYQVTLIAEAACGNDTLTRTVIIQGISVDEVRWLQDLKIAPNPSNGLFEVAIESQINQKLYFRVMGATGQVVLQKTHLVAAGSTKMDLDLRHFSKGVYLLQIESNQGIINRRLIVQ